MPTDIPAPQDPAPTAGQRPRVLARARRRDLAALEARTELAHATDQARALLAASAMHNLAALGALADQLYQVTPTAAPYYDAIIHTYAATAARTITTL